MSQRVNVDINSLGLYPGQVTNSVDYPEYAIAPIYGESQQKDSSDQDEPKEPNGANDQGDPLTPDDSASDQEQTGEPTPVGAPGSGEGEGDSGRSDGNMTGDSSDQDEPKEPNGANDQGDPLTPDDSASDQEQTGEPTPVGAPGSGEGEGDSGSSDGNMTGDSSGGGGASGQNSGSTSDTGSDSTGGDTGEMNDTPDGYVPPSSLPEDNNITKGDLDDALSRLKDELSRNEIARNDPDEEVIPGEYDDTPAGTPPRTETKTEIENLKDLISDTLKDLAKEGDNSLNGVKDLLGKLNQVLKESDKLDTKGGRGGQSLYDDDKLKNVLSNINLVSTCGDNIYKKFVRLVAAPQTLYVMDKASRKIEGMWGGEDTKNSTSFNELLVICDLSASMDKDLLAKVTYNSFIQIKKIDRKVKLNMILFADRVHYETDVKPDYATIRKVLNTNVGHSTKPINVLKLIKDKNIRFRGCIVASDFEFYDNDPQLWLAGMYKKFKHSPILNLVTENGYSDPYEHIKPYTPTKYHLFCILKEGK